MDLILFPHMQSLIMLNAKLKIKSLYLLISLWAQFCKPFISRALTEVNGSSFYIGFIGSGSVLAVLRDITLYPMVEG